MYVDKICITTIFKYTLGNEVPGSRNLPHQMLDVMGCVGFQHKSRFLCLLGTLHSTDFWHLCTTRRNHLFLLRNIKISPVLLSKDLEVRLWQMHWQTAQLTGVIHRSCRQSLKNQRRSFVSFADSVRSGKTIFRHVIRTWVSLRRLRHGHVLFPTSFVNKILWSLLFEWHALHFDCKVQWWNCDEVNSSSKPSL